MRWPPAPSWQLAEREPAGPIPVADSLLRRESSELEKEADALPSLTSSRMLALVSSCPSRCPCFPPHTNGPHRAQRSQFGYVNPNRTLHCQSITCSTP